MKTGLIFLILANLIGVPAPAKNYSAPMGGEAAEYMLSEIIAGNYSEQFDFNGDGQLNIADYYGTMRRYYVNTTEGNEVTEATLYLEFEDYGYYIPIEVDPFSETIRVKEENL